MPTEPRVVADTPGAAARAADTGQPPATAGAGPSPSPSPIAIIGMSCLFPEAGSLEDYWRNISQGIDCITDVPASHWRPDDYVAEDRAAPDMTYARRGGFLAPFPFSPLAFGITPAAIEATDTSQLLGMAVAHQALVDAGYGPDAAFDRERVSVVLGVTGALELVIPLGARLGHPIWRRALRDAGIDPGVAEDVVARIADSYVGWQEASFPGLLGNVVAGRIANRLNLGGTNCVVDAACASSLSALHLAVMELRAGRADMVVTGGVDTFNDIFMYMCFSKTPALSPTGDARPFSRAADGTILGEGIGCVILKRLEDARRDGDRVYAVVTSVGTSSDGKGQAIYAPSAAGQAKALRSAYRLAGIQPGAIELVEAHGTGTKVGDEVELAALRAVYAADAAPAAAAWCALGSVKSQIGHTKAAAGVAGLIKAVMALHHRVLPPTIKAADPAAALAGSPFYLTAEARPWVRPPGAMRRAAVSAFGFGGSNFHCVIEEAAPAAGARPGLRMDGDVQLLPYGAADTGALAALLAADADAAPAGAAPPWALVRAQAAARRACFDAAAPARVCLVASRGDDVARLLRQAAARLTAADAPAHWHGQGAWFDRRPAGPAVAALFPGQGAQYPGMLRGLACAADAVMATLDLADALSAARRPAAPRLSRLIYPPGSAAGTAAEQMARLTATDAAQPALAAVSAGAVQMLRALGVPLAMAAGHSFGELTALYAAGVLELEAYLRLAFERGEVMAAAAEGGGGAMLAVAAGRAATQALIGVGRLGVTIANDNAPGQVVVSGGTPEVAAAAAAFAAQGLVTRPLNVAAGFHSRCVAAAEAPFAAALARTAFAPPTLPVLANATAAAYPAAAAAAKALLARQLTSPVRFVETVDGLYAAGARVFLEIGPGRRLTGLAGATLAGRDDVTLISLDASSGKASGILDLATALAQLLARGVPWRLEAWDEGFRAPAPPAGMTVPLCGANYRKPRPARPPRAAPAADLDVAPVPARSAVAAGPAPTAAGAPPPGDAAQAAPKAARPAAGRQEQVRPQPQPRTPRMPAGPTEPGMFTREAILGLQRLQLQTADLHRQFLEGQRAAQDQFFMLLGGLSGPLESTAEQLEVAPAPPGAPAAPARSSLPAPAPAVARNQPAAAAWMPNAPLSPAAPSAPAAGMAGEPHPLRQAPLPAAPVVPAAASAGAGLNVATLLAVVAEKTGYPQAMLDLGMSLEGDLGIDSIKRVEIMAELQSRLPGAASLPAEELTRLVTLREIADALTAALDFGAAPAPAVRPAAAPAAGDDAAARVAGVVLDVVAAKTGYPAEMLTLAMSLEGDLGIDSIKRVEIFSALQEQLPAAATVGNERLLALATLAEIVGCLAGAAAAAPRGSVASADHVAAPVALTGASSNASADRSAAPIEASAERPDPNAMSPARAGAASSPAAVSDARVAATRAPLTLDEPDRGTASGVERFVLESIALPPAPAPGLLAAAGVKEFWVAAADADDELAAVVCARLEAAGFHPTVRPLGGGEGVALPSPLRGLVIIAPLAPAAARELTLAAFELVQRAATALRQGAEAGGALVGVVTRNGGDFGLSGPRSLAAALLGGLAGLTKTVAHEWPGVRGLAVDIDPLLTPAAAGAAVAAELLGSGPAEVGLSAAGRCGLTLRPEPLAPAAAGAPLLAPGELLVVTGGARGVTAAVALRLALDYQPAVLVLGRSPEPAAEPAWLAGLDGEAAVKAALVAHAESPLSPREVQRAYEQVAAAREVAANLCGLRAAGAAVSYRAVDVRDEAAVGAAVAAAVLVHGPVRAVVHGAGVLADKRIEEQTAAAFAAVYDTKTAGLAAVLAATQPGELRALALFSSSTGRFGRKGQAAYAVANEALNKAGQYYAASLPGCRVLALNWGPWDGGMVTPGLKALFRREGIDVIAVADGAAYLAAELAAAPAPGATELVLLGKAGPARAGASAGPGAAAMDEVFTLALDTQAYPVLRAHVLGGRAVVPAALLLEWLALAAVQRHAGLRFAALEGFQVLKGVTLAPGEAVAVQAVAGPAAGGPQGFRVAVELRGLGASGRPQTFARGVAVLFADGYAPVVPAAAGLARPAATAGAEDMPAVYAEALFHGELLHGITRLYGSDVHGIAAQLAPPPAPGSWGPTPLREDWITEPMTLDCCMQLLVLWCQRYQRAPCLPSGMGRYTQLRPAFPAGGCEARLVVTGVTPGKVTASVELLDGAVLVARLEGLTGTVDTGLHAAFLERRLRAPAPEAARA